MLYKPDNDSHWHISPLRQKRFANLAPALVITAEMDPLRDEGEAYGKKMIEAGSQANLVRIKGVPHIVSSLDGIIDGGKLYNEKALEALGKALN